MNKTAKRSVIGFILSVVGVFSPIIPADVPIVVENSDWIKSMQYASFETETGFLGENQYAVDTDGGYLVADELGHPIKIFELEASHTEEVKFDGKSVFVNVYKDKDSEKEAIVVTHDEVNYEKLAKSEISKPQDTELVSVAEKLVEPTPAEAVILPDSYSSTQSSAATQTVTFAHTTDAADLLAVAIGVRDTGLDEPIQVTYNSVDLTKYTSYASTTLFNASLWYLVSPTTGTNNIFVDFGVSTASADNHNISGVSLDNVDTANVFNASTTAFGVGTSSTVINHLAGSFGLGIRVSNDSSLVGEKLLYYDTLLQDYDAGAYTFWNHMTYLRYASSTANVGAQESTLNGVAFSTDGTKMYTIGTSNDSAFQYTLSTPWDVSTYSYASKSCSVTAVETSPTDLYFKTDGTKLYVIGSGSDKINQYSLSTAWDVSTCTSDAVSTSTIPGETVPSGMFFSADGTKIYTVGTTLDEAGEFTMTTPWDLTTTLFVATTSIGSNPNAISLSEDGQFMRIMRPATEYTQYRLTTYYDISTKVAAKEAIPVSFLEIMTSSGAQGAYWKDRTTAYIMDNTNDTVYTYKQSETATTTSSGLITPARSGSFIYLGGMISPSSGSPATSTSITTPSLFWEE